MPVVSLEKECERFFPELFNTRKLNKRPPVAVVSREWVSYVGLVGRVGDALSGHLFRFCFFSVSS